MGASIFKPLRTACRPVHLKALPPVHLKALPPGTFERAAGVYSMCYCRFSPQIPFPIYPFCKELGSGFGEVFAVGGDEMVVGSEYLYQAGFVGYQIHQVEEAVAIESLVAVVLVKELSSSQWLHSLVKVVGPMALCVYMPIVNAKTFVTYYHNVVKGQPLLSALDFNG